MWNKKYLYLPPIVKINIFRKNLFLIKLKLQNLLPFLRKIDPKNKANYQLIRLFPLLLKCTKNTSWTNQNICRRGHKEAVAQTCCVKKLFLVISQNSQENTCASGSFLIKLQTPAQVFSCEFCEISKNNFFYRTPLVAASDHVNQTLQL